MEEKKLTPTKNEKAINKKQIKGKNHQKKKHVKIQRNSKVTLKEQRIRTRKEDGTQTLERCGLLCSLKKPKLEYWT